MDKQRQPEVTAPNPFSAPPIRDEACERAVLGAMMTSAYAMDEAREALTPECFHSPLHRDIYLAASAVDSRGAAPDMITVAAELARQGADVSPAAVALMASQAPVGPVSEYVARLLDLAARRRFHEIACALFQGAVTETDDIAAVQQKAKEALDGVFSSCGDRVLSIADTSTELLEHVSRNMAGDAEVTGTPTGFREIDRRGGFQPGDLVIIAGETSMGKSSFATNIAVNAARKSFPVAVYSLEMSAKQLTARIVSAQSGVSSSDMLYRRLDDRAFTEVTKGVDAVRGAPLYFDDSAGSSIDKILRSIRSMKIKYGISGAVVDFLQRLNFSGRGGSREQAMGEAAQRLKDLAKELGIWVAALSQLSRNKDYPQPTLNRLRDSGQLEEAADTVILIYRPERVPRNPPFPEPYSGFSTKGAAYIDVAKGRNIGTFSFLTRFDDRTTTFTDAEPGTLERRAAESCGGEYEFKERNRNDMPF